MKPLEIIESIKRGDNTKEAALSALESLLEESNDGNTRIESVQAIARKEVECNRAFKHLEECAISDEDLNVKIAAITALLISYPYKSVTAIKWIIQNDDKIIILDGIRKIVYNSTDPIHMDIFRTLQSRLAAIYGVTDEEALSLLEYQILFQEKKLYRQRFEVDPKSKRVIGIHLNKAELSDVPEVITRFPSLEKLNLSANYFKDLPDIWDRFPRLRTLSLASNDYLESIPDSLFDLSKKNFAAKYEREGVCVSEASVLGLLEILCGFKLQRYVDVYKTIRKEINRKEVVADLHELGGAKWFRELVGEFYCVDRNGLIYDGCDADSNYQFYKRDEEGHVIGLNFQYTQGDYRLSMLPEQIGMLTRLKELEAVNLYLRFIPASICSLRELETLNLELNLIKSVPECVKHLRKLKILRIDNYNS